VSDRHRFTGELRRRAFPSEEQEDHASTASCCSMPVLMANIADLVTL